MARQRNINWNRVHPISVRHSCELSIRHAEVMLNKSVQRVSDEMAEASHFTLYKWMESGRMPAIKIRAFERACGADFVTRYLAHSASYLLIKMPTGRKAEHRDLNDLSRFVHEVMAMLIQFYDKQECTEEVLQGLTGLMEDIAYQRGNIEKYWQPDLLLGGE